MITIKYRSAGDEVETFEGTLSRVADGWVVILAPGRTVYLPAEDISQITVTA